MVDDHLQCANCGSIKVSIVVLVKDRSTDNIDPIQLLGIFHQEDVMEVRPNICKRTIIYLLKREVTQQCLQGPYSQKCLRV